MNARRPVIPGFHPDPSVCRVGEDFWLVNSTFEYSPGVPLFRSDDLRTWEQTGNVLDRPEQLRLVDAAPSEGVFATTIRHHDATLYAITTNVNDGGHLLVSAPRPEGPWSDPVHLRGITGIDPDLAWDEEGTCYLTHAGFGPDGPEGIVQHEIDPRTGEVLTPARRLWQGSGGKFPEGPHLYRVGGYWYLLIAEGGTERGHAVTIARGTSPSGPFETCPHNPLITARGTDDVVQNTGHADLVERPDGRWAMVYHGVRHRGSSPEWHVLGRETFAVEVDWVDGWPVLGAPLEPLAPESAVFREDLDGPQLPSTWIAPRVPAAAVLRRGNNKGNGDGDWQLEVDGAGTPAFVGRRQQHLHATVRTRVSVTGSGGLEVRIDARHRFGLEVHDAVVEAVAVVGDLRQVLGRTELGELPGREVDLQLRMLPAAGQTFATSRGPDLLEASVLGADGRSHVLAVLDGRYVSTEVAGGMTGRVMGLSCSLGTVTVHDFRYLGSDDAAALLDGSAQTVGRSER